MKFLSVVILCCCLIVKLRAETKCQAEVREGMELAAESVEDVDWPSCNADGSYKSLQCGFVGCYCVDKDGEMVTDFANESEEIDALPCLQSMSQ